MLGVVSTAGLRPQFGTLQVLRHSPALKHEVGEKTGQVSPNRHKSRPNTDGLAPPAKVEKLLALSYGTDPKCARRASTTIRQTASACNEDNLTYVSGWYEGRGWASGCVERKGS